MAIIAVQGLFRQVEMAVLATFLGSALSKTLQDDLRKGLQIVQKLIFTTARLLLKSKKHQISDDFCRILGAVPGALD